MLGGVFLGDEQRTPPSISKGDDAFEADGVEFVWGASSVDLAQLNDLFEKVRLRPPRSIVLVEQHGTTRSYSENIVHVCPACPLYSCCREAAILQSICGCISLLPAQNLQTELLKRMYG